MGMRQRYLLGKYNRIKNVFGEYTSQINEINMSSTEFYRTIQSGYSEMMGLIGSKSTKFEFEKDDAKIKNWRKRVPFKIRNKSIDFEKL